MNSVGHRLRQRLLPALLTAIGVGLLATGLGTYTGAVQGAPTPRPYATYHPLPTIDTTIELPTATGSVIVPPPTFPPDRVATRIVVRRLDIDLPVMFQTDNYGLFPLCDVALYSNLMGQPGQGRATYIYAHARDGMFLPLLSASQKNNGKRMLGMNVEVYTSDDWVYLYTITEVRRHTTSLTDALNTTTERLWMQTSEGPSGTVPKLQVVADFLVAEVADPADAHPKPKPRVCG